MLKKITHSAYLNLLSGFILIVTAGIETIVRFGEGSIGAHHGILIFGIIQIVKEIPEILRGLQEIEEARETI